jgi:hypothetical protein
MNMMKTAFFRDELNKIMDAPQAEYADEVVQAAKYFAEDCSGTVEGDMDIDFQQDGRGYYAHLHALFYLARGGRETHQTYRQRLERELEVAAMTGVLDHQMSVVQEQLNLY